ncbi:MAG: AAA family ATPase [Thermoguttaceae bacterium]|nr:AAA family ATPase [Thermoguttaceae bacterium]
MNGQEERAARRPFSSIPDIQAYYPSVSAESARSRLIRALERSEGAAILFGETGLGKTLLLRLLADHFELNVPVLFLSSARIASRRSFYLQLLFQVHGDTSPAEEDDLRVRFFEHLRRSDYGCYALFIDNADTLSAAVIDELCSLLDIDYYGAARFRVALSGTARLEDRLNAPKFTRFSQRIAARAWLDPFSRDETAAYLDRQMEMATADYGGLKFSAEAARRVHKLSEGVPRVINQICDLALYLDSASQELIPEKTVEKAWGLLQQIPDEESVSGSGPELAETPGESDPAFGFTADEESSSVVEFGSLDSPDEDFEKETPAAAPFEAQEESSAVEFGRLEDDLPSEDEVILPPEKKTLPAGGIDTQAGLGENSGTETDHEDSETEVILPLVPKATLPEESLFASDSETGSGDDVQVVSMDGQKVEWHSGEVPARRSGGAESPDESWHAGKTFSAADPDLTGDALIREKLMREYPGKDAETASDRFQAGETHDSLADGTARYLEELRLMEMDVAQEADLIRKIREMETGLRPLPNPEPNPREPETEPQQERASSKNRPFYHVFEKIYTKKDRKN